MNNESDRSHLLLVHDIDIVRRDACLLESHDDCRPEDCEVREATLISEQITRGQITIGLATAITGLGLSTLFALAVLVVWIWCAFTGSKFPDIPLLFSTIAGAPFAAGAITVLKIPKKAKVELHGE